MKKIAIYIAFICLGCGGLTLYGQSPNPEPPKDPTKVDQVTQNQIDEGLLDPDAQTEPASISAEIYSEETGVADPPAPPTKLLSTPEKMLREDEGRDQ